MRTIKFRAWDGKTMKVQPVIDGQTGDAIDIWVGESGTLDLRPNGLTLMQFTGLTDKNGKEIYEGDILLNKHGWSCEVRWHKLGWKLYSKGRSFPDSLRNILSMEVIGNIYENSDLLAQTN